MTHELSASWQGGGLPVGAAQVLPDRPARADRLVLLPPADVPRRRISRGTRGRAALLHALAHIELNAIDLAWDIVARFAPMGLPHGFFDDWVRVAHEEATHFELLTTRLAELDTAYGDLPAHDGLWDAAVSTGHDLAARLAVVPLVLEARGLDVTPAIIERLRAVDDHASAAVLEVIYRDEIGHVAIGRNWFEHICAERGYEPETQWQNLVETCFRGVLKPPYNVDARTAAGFPESWYMGISAYIDG
jgi:uncharacterized ferritin-like protein (DUF455 family)